MSKNYRRPVIIVSTGDPAGIGPEISLKALMNPEVSRDLLIIPVGQAQTLERAAELVGFPLKLEPVKSLKEAASAGSRSLPYFAAGDSLSAPAGIHSRESGKITLAILRKAVSLCMDHPEEKVLVTAPINKMSLTLAGQKAVGHTEILKELTGAAESETIFCLESLKVFFLSRHMSLRDALDVITKDAVCEALARMDRIMKTLGVARPRLGLPGLNPHCGEGGNFGHEEERCLIPAAVEAREMGLAVEDPVGADSIFHRGFCGDYDAILSLYHDQGHIALKTRDFYGTVTMTWGLPFLRTSVDHGTGYDMAWKGIASERSLVEALLLAVRYGRGSPDEGAGSL